MIADPISPTATALILDAIGSEVSMVRADLERALERWSEIGWRMVPPQGETPKLDVNGYASLVSMMLPGAVHNVRLLDEELSRLRASVPADPDAVPV